MAKPDRRIFDHLIAAYGLNAGETLFIDDLAQNVAVASAAGWRTILFTGPEALRTSLHELGLL
jgi:2-haloacid dehalogenase